MVHLVRGTPILRRRAFYQGCLFFAFSLFWTTTPLAAGWAALWPDAERHRAFRARRRFRSHRRADRRPGRRSRLGPAGDRRRNRTRCARDARRRSLSRKARSSRSRFWSSPRLRSTSACQANLVLGFRAIFSLAPDARGRLNGVYLSTAFVGGAIGSALGAWAYARGGWSLACCVGLTPPIIALSRFLIGVATGSE